MKKRHMDKVYLVNDGVERAQPQFRYLMRQPGCGCLRIGAVMKLLLRFSRATDASSFQRSWIAYLSVSYGTSNHTLVSDESSIKLSISQKMLKFLDNLWLRVFSNNCYL